MDIQAERIRVSCELLGLDRVPEIYPVVAEAAIKAEQGFADFLEALLKEEVSGRQQRSRTVLTRLAGFPVIKTLDNFDFKFASDIPKARIQELFSLAFVERTENIMLLGPSGVGKTHLAIALGVQACRHGHRVLFATATDWVTRLTEAHRAGKLAAELTRLRRVATESAEAQRARLLAVALPPTVPHAFPVTTTERYGRIADRFGMIAHEQGISGCHVHVAVPSRAAARASWMNRPWNT